MCCLRKTARNRIENSVISDKSAFSGGSNFSGAAEASAEFMRAPIASAGDSGGGGGVGSTLSISYGKRNLKAYPITEAELSRLSGIGYWATACFSISGFLGGFSLDLFKDLALVGGVAAAPAKLWGYIQNLSAVLAVIFLLLGIGLFFLRKKSIDEIKKQTEFDR